MKVEDTETKEAIRTLLQEAVNDGSSVNSYSLTFNDGRRGIVVVALGEHADTLRQVLQSMAGEKN